MDLEDIRWIGQWKKGREEKEDSDDLLSILTSVTCEYRKVDLLSALGKKEKKEEKTTYFSGTSSVVFSADTVTVNNGIVQ